MRKLAVISGMLMLVTVTFWILCPKPEIENFVSYSRVYLDRDERLLRITLADDERYRIYQPLDRIDAKFIEATLLYEDRDYYQHRGVDLIALSRAFWSTYVSGERRIGASTITMQVARMKWGIESNTVSGKIEQIFRALQLSRHFSKQQLLEIYLNNAPYGRNIEGVAAASQIYFGKTADNLSLLESLTLAVIPQNPNKRNPTTDSGYHNLLQARQNLLKRWLEQHPEDAASAKYFSLPLKVRAPQSLPFEAPHFVNFVEIEIPQWDRGYVHTTLDLDKQEKISKMISRYIEQQSQVGIRNASAMLLNYQTMEIEAMVGSADFFSRQILGQVNGTLAKRSPGSTLKPFVYALALEEGLIHPKTLLKDSPRRFGGFTPENYDKRFIGPISANQALIKSRNVPAVDLQSRLKARSFHRFLKDAGIKRLREESFYGLALALGGGELTMLELVSLYAVLANHGVQKPVRWAANQTRSDGRKLLSAEASFLILDILKDNPAAFDNSRRSFDVAWKTGTSWSFRDAWAIGISGSYVAAVWVGNFDGSGNPAFKGRQAAGPLLFTILDAVQSQSEWRVRDHLDDHPLNIKQLQVCASTGDLYEKNCPISEPSWFIPGVSPIRVSNVYREIPIDQQTGLRACWHQPGKTEMKVYEFWPSDYLRVFSQAGIMLKTPPAFDASCNFEEKGGGGLIPVITSPQQSIEYILSLQSEESQRIPMEVTVDPGVEQVYWFVDGAFAGTAARGEVFFWNAIPGKFEARVVDDSGRAASKQFVVSQIE